MEYSNCAKCGKMFLRVNNPICPECEKEEERLFIAIKAYLDEHPSNSISEVSEATGASIKKILKFIKDGRIEMSVGIAGEKLLRCIRCGTHISSGTYCDSCQVQYSQAVQGMINDSKNAKQSVGMHSKPSAIEKKLR